MPGTEPAIPSALAPPRGSWWPVAILIVGVLLARWAYLAWICPFGLIEDEAQYWDWARRLDWSYYTKGPGVAWTIAASDRLWGNSVWAVRWTSPLCSALLAWAMAWLTCDARGGDRRLAFWVAAACHLAPAFQATALLGTIDAPLCAGWAIACAAAWRALRRQGTWAWPALGLAVGITFLFKYTVLLLLPGLIGFAWFSRRELRLDRRWWVWSLVALVFLLVATAPVLIWNQREGWPTIRHLLGHLGAAERLGDAPPTPTLSRPAYTPRWTLELLGAQLLLVGPLLVLGAWATLRPLGPSSATADERLGRRFLIWAAAPIFLFYLLVSFIAEPEGNWPMAGFVTLVPLAAWAGMTGIDQRRHALAAGLPRRDNPAQVLWHWSLVYGSVAGLGVLFIQNLAGVPVLGPLVPLARLNQGPLLAHAVAPIVERVHAETGREPLLIAQHYGRASQLAFYLPGRPITFCASSLLGGRPTNHDFWPDTNLRDPALAGRSAVLVGGWSEQWAPFFDTVEPLGLLAGAERKGVSGFVGRGYRPPGLSSPKGPPTP